MTPIQFALYVTGAAVVIIAALEKPERGKTILLAIASSILLISAVKGALTNTIGHFNHFFWIYLAFALLFSYLTWLFVFRFVRLFSKPAAPSN